MTDKIARLKMSLSSSIGEKLSANIKLQEDELEWRKRLGSDQEELHALNPCDRKRTLNNQFSQRKRHKREQLSQEAPYKSPVDKGEKVLNVDLKGRDSSTRSKENIASCFSEKIKDSQAQSSYTRRNANAVVLVDEEDPVAIKGTEQVDQVIELVDPESIEIYCADMESLAPEAYLSSTTINFYIQYLQKTKPLADVDVSLFQYIILPEAQRGCTE